MFCVANECTLKLVNHLRNSWETTIDQRHLFITNHTTNTKVFTIESRSHLFITSITNQTKLLNPNKPKEQTEQQHIQTQLFPNENDILLHYNLDSSSSSTSIHNVTAKRFSYAMSLDYDETVYYTYTPNSSIYNNWMDTHSFITISPNGCQRNLLLVHDYLYLKPYSSSPQPRGLGCN